MIDLNLMSERTEIASLKMLLFMMSICFLTTQSIYAQQPVSLDYVKYQGVVLDNNTKKPLEYASISVSNSNITTITNSEGEFVLKVSNSFLDESVTIIYLGFANKTISLSEFSEGKTKIYMNPSSVDLPEINVVSKDPNLIIRKLQENKSINYMDNPVVMTAFYRESIKKRNKYASLSEAVVDIHKQSYRSHKFDYVKLNKARKSTNYKRIDTLVIKLQGGPYNNLNIDIIKNKEMFFDNNIFRNYKFVYEKTIHINNRKTYVIKFHPQNYVVDLMYSGKLYIDSETYALSRAVFSLNLEDEIMAKEYFVKKKPVTADVTPVVASYMVDYRLQNGKWYFGYSRIELTFKINWVKKIFNSVYNISIEMAITDWRAYTENDKLKSREKLKTRSILNDEVTGFSNPEFWGKYNVIEPDKSIENAIRKIKRQ